jgi:uncharacterized protein YeaO (DUF488 family)
MSQNYAFAELSEQAIHELKQLESRLQQELGEDITLIAYAKDEAERDTTACRADLKGD